jgi:hypothetical protein
MKVSLRFRESVVARAHDGRIVITLIGRAPGDVVVADGWPREVHALQRAIERALRRPPNDDEPVG